MGDIRNKLAKIERAKEEKAAFEAFLRRSSYRPPPTERQEVGRCQGEGCGLTMYETQLWACERDGIFCRACMPWKFKVVIFGQMINQGLKYDPADHGEDPDSSDGR